MFDNLITVQLLKRLTYNDHINCQHENNADFYAVDENDLASLRYLS